MKFGLFQICDCPKSQNTFNSDSVIWRNILLETSRVKKCPAVLILFGYFRHQMLIVGVEFNELD
jgi:hypothetical protein